MPARMVDLVPKCPWPAPTPHPRHRQVCHRVLIAAAQIVVCGTSAPTNRFSADYSPVRQSSVVPAHPPALTLGNRPIDMALAVLTGE
jgi:hypothetical protein